MGKLWDQPSSEQREHLISFVQCMIRQNRKRVRVPNTPKLAHHRRGAILTRFVISHTLTSLRAAFDAAKTHIVVRGSA
jgi:hypothetical protein